MSYLGDHMHEVEIRVEGVVVHVHQMMFVGVPGEVTVRHRSQPIEVCGRQEEEPLALPPSPGEWEDYDPDEWGQAEGA